jgi:hypothetical protein
MLFIVMWSLAIAVLFSVVIWNFVLPQNGNDSINDASTPTVASKDDPQNTKSGAGAEKSQNSIKVLYGSQTGTAKKWADILARFDEY